MRCAVCGVRCDTFQGGFRGWVVTDWGAQHDSIASALAGLDQQMEYDAGAVVTRDGTIGFNTSAFRKALLNGVYEDMYIYI